jgi:hypothetical protein
MAHVNYKNLESGEKYYTVTVKPTMLAAKMHLETYSTLDVLFDWTPFPLPRGANRLVGTTALVRGADGAAQQINFDLYFAKSTSAGVAPSSIGTEHATANGVGYYNELIGTQQILVADYSHGLDFMSVATAQTVGGSGGGQSPIMMSSHGTGQQDQFYVAGIDITGGDFHSDCAINESEGYAAGASRALTLNGTGASSMFDVGDVIAAHDGAAIGTIATVSSDTAITLERENIDALENADLVYNVNPITLIFSFERGN